MFVSYKWLQQYVDLDGISAAELADKITKGGIEVEGVEKKSEGIKGVVVGYVQEKVKHPQADKLNVCQVDIGAEEPVQIVCGAANVDAGQKVAVATVGAVLPGNFKIKKAKLRGEASHGMICSLQELGFESKLIAKDYSTGIFVFPDDVEVGKDALEQLNLDDEILELSLTPNRSDCLSMLGVAYEVAAILRKEVKWPEISLEEEEKTADSMITVEVEAPEAAPLYTAKVIKDVKVGPSPLWMQTTLMAAGIRPHNNVVDITNYVLLEYGQPLHAFDYDKVGSGKIVVREAKAGEKLVTLDEAERSLEPHHLVITNGTEPIALAGVMGGANTEVDESTTTVLLESAYFASSSIRRTSKELGLRSEASARYEKGVDPERVRAAGERAAALMAEYAGGTVLSGTVEVNTLNVEPAVVTITVEKINTLLGTDIKMEEVEAIFSALKFETSVDGDSITVTVPSRRGDITIPEDLVEEVARMYGYDNIPKTLPNASGTAGRLSPYQEKRRTVRRYLEGAGLYQAITYALTSPDKATAFALEKKETVKLAMPMSEERSTLRQSLVPQLLEAAQYNVARQNDSVALYEVGTIFLDTEEVLPEEREHAAGIITGSWHTQLWQGEKKAVDFFVAKGILEGLFTKLGLADQIAFSAAALEGMHPGRTAAITLDGRYIGYVGQVHPNVEKQHDLKETFVFELCLKQLLNKETTLIAYQSIPRYPSITRDIALVVDKDAIVGEIRSVIVEAGGRLLTDVSVFDLYEGDKMEAGKKSIAFSLKYQDPDKTMTDEEVTKAHDKVLAAVKEKAGAELRG